MNGKTVEHPNGLRETPAAVDRFTTLMPSTAMHAAGYLLSAFTWEESREGHEYWKAIHDRLEEIANTGRTKSEPGAAPHV